MEKIDVIGQIRRGKGKAIRDAREAAGLSQAELAQKAGTSQQTVDRIERGVTEHSRAYPRLREALGLAPEGGFDSQRTVDNRRQADATLERHKLHPNLWSDPISGGLIKSKENITLSNSHLPVYGSDPSSIIRIVDTIPRLYPVQTVPDAYAIMVSDGEMTPVIRIGDLVVVNPYLPTQPNSEVVVIRGTGDERQLRILTLASETDEAWLLTTPEALARIELKKEPEVRVHMIVSKISRVR